MDDATRQAMRLWTLAQPVVSAYLWTMVRDFSVRDDLLQETAVEVMDSFAKFDASRSFLAWAMGIARNQVRLYARQRSREIQLFSDDFAESLAQTFERVSAFESSRLEYLGECLEQLDARARELCRLRYFEDLKPLAISQRLGMSANTVAKALQRIRDQLRDCVDNKALRAGDPA